MKRAILRVALMMLALGGMATARAQGAPETLDKIVATVDDEVILLSAVVQDVQLFLMQTGSKVDSLQYRQLMDQSLDNMINEKILLAKARRDQIEIGQDELDAALDHHIEGLVQQAGGQTEFQRQLDNEGMDLRELRKRLTDPMKDQLMVQHVVEKVTFGLEVGEQEAREFFEANKSDPETIPLRPEAVRISHLLIIPKPAPEVEAALRVGWKAALDSLDAGMEFSDAAKAFSKGPAAEQGGDLGWIDIQDIAQPLLQETLMGLQPGEIARDVMTETGLHILKMIERDGARVHFSQIVFPVEIGEEDRSRARERAREAWKFLNAGGDWNEAVTRYSDDEFSRDQAGELPLIPLSQLEDRYRDIIELLEPGEYSTVFKGVRGYQIVKLDERQSPRPFEFDEIKDQLRTELLSRKRNEAIDRYLKQLKGEIIVQRMGIPDPDSVEATGSGAP